MFFRRERPKHLTFEDHMSAARAAGFRTDSATGAKTRIDRNGIALHLANSETTRQWEAFTLRGIKVEDLDCHKLLGVFVNPNFRLVIGRKPSRGTIPFVNRRERASSDLLKLLIGNIHLRFSGGENWVWRGTRFLRFIGLSPNIAS